MNKNDNISRADRLGKQPVLSLLVKFSVPAIVGMVVNALYNVVDRIFIGQGVGEIAIGGLYVGMPIMLIIMAFGMLIGIGGNTLVSIRLGEGRKEEADRIASNSLVLLVIIGLALGFIIFVFLQPILKIFGASESNIGYATDYMRIILLGIVFQNIGFGMNNFIRGEGNPTVAMKTMLIGAITNIVLDPIFIFVFKMGVQGAALATIISQFVSAVWVLRYFFSGISILHFKKEYLIPNLGIVKQITANGFAPFSMQIAASGVTALYNNNLMSLGGDLALSSMGIINSIAMMVLMPVFGLNQGSQPIIGYNYGAKNYERVKQALKYAIIAATTITTLGFLIVQFAPQYIVSLFVGEAGAQGEMLKIATTGMRINLSMLPVIGFQVISVAYFQATGKPKQAMLLSLSRQVLVLIPALLILPKLLGLNGVWLSGPVSDSISALLSAIMIYKSIKALR